MDALDLILLGRQLMKIGEETIRGSQTEVLPTGQALVLRDVFANPSSSIMQITARTGMPQSYVSESVARLRERGMLLTAVDPCDGRRTLVRLSEEHPRNVARKGAASVDGALVLALGDPDAVSVLATFAERLRSARPGSILEQLAAARAPR